MTSAARFLRAADYPDGVTEERYELMLNGIGEHWGTGERSETMWARVARFEGDPAELQKL